MNYRKHLSLLATAFGAAFSLGAVAALFVLQRHNRIDALLCIALALIFCGGLSLAALSLLRVYALNDYSRSLTKKTPDASLQTRQFKLGAHQLTALVLTIAAVLFLIAYSYAQETEEIPQSTVQSGIFYETGKVLEIEDEVYQGIQDVEDVPVGSQQVLVEIQTGDFEGERYSLKNDLSYLYGTLLEVGDRVTVSFSITNGEIDGTPLLQDYDRTIPLSVILVLFIAITVLVGGKVGAKSLLGLGLTILCIFSVMIPLLLGGANTLWCIFGLCAYVTVVEFVILGGVNKKTICAILGTISGVIFALLFGQFACWLLRIDGFKMYGAESAVEALLQIKQTQNPAASLQIGDLLVGGILIAALGAVNDVAMSISSAMNELVAVDPTLSYKKLVKSGMNIGRDMVGTMTNTLILALVGSSLVVLIYYSTLGLTFRRLASAVFFSVEFVQAIASSIGVILAVPMSVLLGAALFVRHSKKKTA